MKSSLLRFGALLAALVLASCQKNEAPVTKAEASKSAAPSVALVKENERSKSFLAVQKQLELGGTLYGYVDIDGDVRKLTTSAQGLLKEMGKTQPQLAPFAQQDLGEIATILGLNDIKAVGVSSVPDGTGYFRNRMFFYTGGERHGLMAAMGGKGGAFKHLKYAPADAVFYGESELDMAVVYKTLKDVVAKVAGPEMGDMMETSLQRAGEAAALKLVELINGLKGNAAVVLRIDPTKTFRPPGQGAIALPMFQLVIVIENIGGLVEPSLAKAGLKRTDQGAVHLYTPPQQIPIEGLEPAILVDGTTLFLTSSLPFLNECRELKSGLAQAPEFQKALAQVGTTGNGLTYVSPKLFEQIKRIEALNPQMPAETKSIFSFVMNNLPKPDRPLVAVRTNLDDGILVRTYWNRSMKQDVAAVAIYNPVTVGLLAAMAIPAFQKVRANSQDKAILNNLRQLAAAADQYYLENGVSTATYDQLVGPTKYVKIIQPVAGENYRALRFQQGQPLQVRLRDGRVIRYDP